jgi:photosystem II stability/assembly factor-like uncharacterized protein
VVLREGRNVLLLKVSGESVQWGMAHFTDGAELSCSLDQDEPGVALTLYDPLWVPIADQPAEAEISVVDSVRGTLYAGTEGHGVLRFNEAAKAWDALNDGLPTDEYVFVNDFLALDDTLYAATSHGVFRLRLGAERWERRIGDLTDFYATTITASDDWMFAGTWEGHIYRSPDRGHTWEQVYGDGSKAKAGGAILDVARR